MVVYEVAYVLLLTSLVTVDIIGLTKSSEVNFLTGSMNSF